MATDTYTLEYVARIEKLQAELAKIPGATDRSALAAAQRLEARLDKASKQAGKAVEGNIGGALKRLAQGSGYGDIAEKLSNLGEGVSALGAGSMVAAGGIAAIAAAGVGLYAATASTGALADENARLRREVDDLVYSVGTLMPGAFEGATNALTSIVSATRPAVTGLRELINVGGELVDEFTTQSAITIGMFTAALSGNAVEAQRWADVYNSSRGYVGAIEAGTKATVEAELALRALRYNQTQWQGPKLPPPDNERPKAARAAALATREHATALEQEIAALKARDPWMEKAVELDEREARALADVDVGIRETSAALAEGQALRESEAMAWAEIVDGLRTTRQKSIEAAKASRDAWVSTTGDIAGSVGTVLGLLAEQEGVSKRTAKALVIAQKAAGIAQVGISTAVAIMQALASFGPAGPAVAAGYAATGLAQAAVIAATPLPSFHQGGRMQGDEGLAVVRKGERVVTERAARDYDQGLGDANRGAARTAAGPVRVLFEGRDLDVMLARVVRQHGATRRELDSRRAAGAY